MADLFGFEPAAECDPAPLRDAFARYHRENPEIYALFDKFAQQAIAKGYKRFSADALLHRIRWEASVDGAGCPYKINNIYSAYYARLWIENNPGREKFFELRAAEGEAACS